MAAGAKTTRKTARRATKAKGKEPYSVHPAIAMVENWIARLPETTGRSLDQWLALLKRDGPADPAAHAAWLKKAHGFGTNESHWIAGRAAGKGFADEDPDSYLDAAARYVEAMYVGPKAALRPIHDRLVALGRSMGEDVRVCPCTTIVPLYRKHVFAQIKPTTQTRIDFGLCLRGVKPAGRLVSTGGEAKGDRITHRIVVERVEDVDATVARWLRTAYERDA